MEDGMKTEIPPVGVLLQYRSDQLHPQYAKQIRRSEQARQIAIQFPEMGSPGEVYTLLNRLIEEPKSARLLTATQADCLGRYYNLPGETLFNMDTLYHGHLERKVRDRRDARKWLEWGVRTLIQQPARLIGYCLGMILPGITSGLETADRHLIELRKSRHDDGKRSGERPQVALYVDPQSEVGDPGESPEAVTSAAPGDSDPEKPKPA